MAGAADPLSHLLSAAAAAAAAASSSHHLHLHSRSSLDPLCRGLPAEHNIGVSSASSPHAPKPRRRRDHAPMPRLRRGRCSPPHIRRATPRCWVWWNSFPPPPTSSPPSLASAMAQPALSPAHGRSSTMSRGEERSGWWDAV